MLLPAAALAALLLLLLLQLPGLAQFDSQPTDCNAECFGLLSTVIFQGMTLRTTCTTPLLDSQSANQALNQSEGPVE